MRESASQFFTELNYSSSVEDGRSELTALQLSPSDRVLAVTASGLRVLDLLLGDPGEVVAVDLNPAQNALLALHLAALKRLDYDAWLRLLGVRPEPSRHTLYKAVAADLDQGAQAFFAARPRLIAAGPLYQGRWERYLRWMSWCGAPRRRLVEALFTAPDLEAQYTLWEREWEGPVWRTILAFLGWRSLWSRVVDEPGIHLVDGGFSIASYIHRRFRVLARNTLLRESPYASLAFFGTHRYLLPLALREENFPILQERAERVRWRTTTLLEAARREGPNSLSAYALSDFSSYADVEEYRATWEAVRRSARPGSRVCERQFLVKRTAPPVGLIRNATLEAELDNKDDSFIYTFVCGVLG
jgi:S-adenosylmethionine-diacylglycerol 3-amino-3-carboxypropyl transferase